MFAPRMHRIRVLSKRLLLLVIVIVTMLAGCAVAGSEQCKVKDIYVTSSEVNSTYAFNFTYDHPTCTKKEGMEVRLESCDGITDTFILNAKDEGLTHNCSDEGKWKVTVYNKGEWMDGIQSTCFKCSGLNMKSIINAELNTQGLNMTVRNVHMHVKNWSITIYETTKKGTRYGCNERSQMEKINKLFRKTRLQPQNISRTDGQSWGIERPHDLDPEGCYCIMMRPISDYDLWPRSYKLSTSDCKPTKPGAPNGGETIVDMAMSREDMVTLMVLMGVILLFGMLFTAIACKPLFLSRLLGLKTVKARRESSLREQMVSRNTAVLLLHTPDISGSEHLAKLKQRLQNTFKVHDLFVYNDYKRLADPCGWMQEMLMPNSGVKLLVVESVGLMRQINSLLNSSPENPFLKKAAQSSPKTDDLLTYALWTIICTNLREDYSSVFVVRLSDEMKDVAELLVQTRRYKFPDHFSELIKAMTTTRLSHIRDEQQKSPE